MGAFFAASFFLMITPGPGVLTTAGIGSAFGYGPGLRFLAGLLIGTNLVILAIASGLATVVLSVPGLRMIMLIGSTGYLFYLACRIALSGSRIAFIESKRAPGFVDGIILQFINPKAYAVNSVLMGGFGFWPASIWIEVAIKLAIVNVLWIPIHLGWLAAGVSLRRLNLSIKAQRAINIGMAIAMVAVVIISLLASRSVYDWG